MRQNFLFQLLPDMEEVYDNDSTSEEDEQAIFITQQNGTLNTGKIYLKLVVWRTRVTFISPFNFFFFQDNLIESPHGILITVFIHL